MAALYVRKDPEAFRRTLARELQRRLSGQGISYHIRTVRRQLSGQISTVPVEVEASMQESNGFRTAADLEKVLIAEGLQVPSEDRLASYIPADRLVPLAQQWLCLNPGRSKRSLAALLQKELAVEGVQLNVNLLQNVLAGKRYRSARREVREKLLKLLADHDFSSERAALRYRQSLKNRIGRSQENQTLVPSNRVVQLFWLWKISHHEPSSRDLIERLQQKISQQGLSPLSGAHLRRLLHGKMSRVRRTVVSALEAILREDFPNVSDWEKQMAKLTPRQVTDLSWVKAEPTAALARKWVAQHPEHSMRQLAIRVSKTIQRMEYRTTPNTVQTVLGAHKKTTRGFIYRAMLMQFNSRHCKVPAEDIIEPTSLGAPGVALYRATQNSGDNGHQIRQCRSRRRQTLQGYLKEARSYLPFARSPHFLPFVAFRAERLYGMPHKEAEAWILGVES